MIEVNALEKGFDRVRALRGVSFHVPKAQVAGLLGVNGAGKTTAIRVITGFLTPDAGSARVAGFDTVTQSELARGAIGYLPESAPAYPEMLAEAFLRFRGRLYGLAGRRLRAAVDRVVAQCHLGPVRRRRVGHLSKGYRQRVGLAAALIHDPPVLVLDEPTNGLDPTQIREARTLLRGLGEERTVLISSHILGEIEAVCDRVIMLSHGRVFADGAVAALAGAGGACIVEARGPAPDAPSAAREALAAVRGARGVREAVVEREDEGGWVRVRCVGDGGLREAIGAAAAGSGVTLRELREQSPGLEGLFIDAVERASVGGDP